MAVPMTATSNQPITPPDAVTAANAGGERVASGEASSSTPSSPAPSVTVVEVPKPEKSEAKEPSKRGKKAGGGEGKAAKGPIQPNNVRKLRQAAMMSKAELARRAGVSPLTIDRVEAGMPCRMDTKRKILEALGLSPSAREQVFGPDIDQG